MVNSIQRILSVYFLGLFISLLVGIGAWISIRSRLKDFLQWLAPLPLKTLAWNLIKVSLLVTVLVGGMTSKYYGCLGEYQEIEKSNLALFEKFTGQLTSSLSAVVTFLLLLLVFSLLFFVITLTPLKDDS